MCSCNSREQNIKPIQKEVPKSSLRFGVPIVVFLFGLAVLFTLANWYLCQFLLFFVGFWILTFLLYYFILLTLMRCPDCKSWLFRSRSCDSQSKHRFFYCSKCNIIWDSGVPRPDFEV